MPLRQIFQSIHLVTFPTISDHAQDELLETKYQRLKKHFSFIVISMQASTKLFLKGNIILILKFKVCGQICGKGNSKFMLLCGVCMGQSTR